MTTIIRDLTGYLLLIGMFLLFLFADQFRVADYYTISTDLLNVNSIFLSIVLEAIPFILLGVFASAIIQTFVSEEMIQRFIPKRPILALIPAVIISALLPVCECAIIPVVRRLIKKGMPLHIGVVLLVAAPILNPIVFLSTYHAFSSNMVVVWSRMGLAAVAAILIGGIIYYLFKEKDQLKESLSRSHNEHHHHSNKLVETLMHASDEFFDMGKFLLFGAFIASLFQTFLDRQMLVEIGSGVISGPMVMMVFGYVLSLCSEADAFVASSFGNTFSIASILAFLVYGPMIDLKNTIVFLAYFKLRFVLAFIGVVTVVVFVLIQLLQFIGIG